MSNILYLTDLFEEREELGKGQYCRVISVDVKDRQRLTQRLYIKDIPNKLALKIYKGRSHLLDQEMSILEYLGKLNIPGVMRYYGNLNLTHDNKLKPVLLLEQVDGSNLHESLFTLTAKQIKSIIRQLLKIVNLLHENKVIHRDIKLNNLIYCPEKDRLTLVDFGFAILNRISPLNRPLNVAGTPIYLAPELWPEDGKVKISPEIRTSEDMELLNKADIWSSGITIYWLIYGKSPFDDCNTYAELNEAVKNQEIKYPSECIFPEEARFLPRLLEKDWKKRSNLPIV